MTIALIAVCVMATIFTAVLMPNIIRIAAEKKLFDQPDHRKIHQETISPLGGIGMFCGFWLSLFLFSDFITPAYFNLLFVTTFSLLLVGIYDDLLVMNSYKKLAYQVIAANLLWFGGLEGSFIVQFGIVGGELAVWGVTVFLIVLIVNAYNLIDGLNGLAGTQSLIALIGFSVIFLLNNNFNLAILGIAGAGVLIAFLYFNYGRASIFMGDNGSMFIGLLLAVLFLESINLCFEPMAQLSISPLVPLSLVFLPVADMARVAIMRILKGFSPFRPDRTHIHHLLKDLNKSHSEVSTILIFLKLKLIGIALYFGQTNDLSLGIVLMISTIGIAIIYAHLSSSLTHLKKSEVERHAIYYME